MKKNHFELKNYVMATGVFILAVIAGILIFFECVQRAEMCIRDRKYHMAESCTEKSRFRRKNEL